MTISNRVLTAARTLLRIWLNRPPLILHRLAVRRAEQERAERRETLTLLRSMDERLMRVEEAIREQKRGGE